MTVIQHRRGTASEWITAQAAIDPTPILSAGEIGLETDTMKIKIGDGVSLWSALAYVGVGLQNVVEDTTPQLGGDLDTNGFDITNVNAITFDTTPTDVPVGIGVLSWNAVDKTLDLQSDGITYQLGQELAQNVMRFDASGLTNGKVVYITGSSGANLLVDYAIATSDATSGNTFAVMTADASGGAKAPATTFGLVRGIDTSALTEGATVWLSGTVAGGMTTTKPVAPTHTIQVGFCIRSHATEGIVFVNVQNGYEIAELHDVLISTPTDNNLLAYDASSSLWKNQTAAEANLAALTGATFTGAVSMSAGQALNIYDADSLTGRLIGASNVTYLQAGANSSDTSAALWITRTASSSNIADFTVKADATTLSGTLGVSGATTLTGLLTANGGIAGATAKNMTVASSYSGTTFNGTKVIMVASATGAADPTTRPDGTALQAGDIWIDW